MADFSATQDFLTALGSGPFVFQTYTDNKSRRKQSVQRTGRDPLARKLSGTLESNFAKLSALNEKGAGIFVQVNRGIHRGKENITGIRALFLDLDDVANADESMASLANYMPEPTIVTVSSPGKYHYYWLVKDCPLDAFVKIQKSLAITFRGDIEVATLERVMRLPGFIHKKGAPQLVTASTGTHQYDLAFLVKCASEAPVLTPTGLPAAVATRTGLSYAPNPHDIFGLDVHEELVSLPPGNRTQPLVRHIGLLVHDGFSAEHIEKEVRRLNIDLCPEGKEPLLESDLQCEILPCIKKFVDKREAELAATDDDELPPPPPKRTPKDELPPPPKRTPKDDLPPPPPSKQVLSNEVPAPPPVAASVPDVDDTPHSLERWLDRFLFVGEGSRVVDQQLAGEFAVYPLMDFKNTYANVFASKGKGMVTKWLAHKQRKNVRSLTYMPTTEKVTIMNGVRMWNTYKPSDVRPIAKMAYDPDRVQPFIDHLEMIFTVKSDRDVFTNWMMMTLKHPEIKVPWMPLLLSKQGAGKGFIFKVLSKLLGDHNCNIIGAKRLEQDFNGFMKDSTLVLIDEMSKASRSGVLDSLNMIISETRLELNVKKIAERTTDVYANIIGFSNSVLPAYIVDDDRRFWVYRWDYVPPAEYFDTLWPWLADPENMRHVAYWVASYEFKDFRHSARPPMTAAKLEVIESNKSEVELDLLQAIEDRSGPFKADILSYSMAKDYLTQTHDSHVIGRAEGLLRQIWANVSDPLPESLSRVPLKIGKANQVRVRCVRGTKWWANRSRDDISHEATRAMQFIVSPDSVLPPVIVEAR